MTHPTAVDCGGFSDMITCCPARWSGRFANRSYIGIRVVTIADTRVSVLGGVAYKVGQ